MSAKRYEYLEASDVFVGPGGEYVSAVDYDKAIAALKVCHQALLEVMHAQEVGASWYTRGESGLYAQVRMWVRNGFEAIRSTGEGPF